MPAVASPSSPRFEHLAAGGSVLGIGVGAPRLSWQVGSASKDFVQHGYEVEVEYDSGARELIRLDSNDQVLVDWPTRPLASRESATVRVRVRSSDDWSDWSATSRVEAGLLSANDWSACLISPRTIGAIGAPAPCLIKDWECPQQVQQARLYITAHGLYEAHINGARVGDQQLTPGWTSYSKRLRYQTYDVTSMLTTGQNTIQVLLGNGWYRGRLGWDGLRAFYGERLGVIAQLEITYQDGSVETVATDDTWRAQPSAVLADDLYDGTTIDMRLASTTDDASVRPDASPVDVQPLDPAVLIAPEGPPVRATQTVAARHVFRSPSGALLVDFGQVLVGWARLNVAGRPAGSTVTITHAEVLENGELGVRPLRSAKARDTYILSGGDETLEPRFTFHGFRYVQIDGVDDIEGIDVTAVVVGTDLTRTGSFSCSVELLNRLHENVIWSLRSNMLDVPTDCPQRDERFGWTGDIQVFTPTATYLFDTAGFLSSWLADLAADQRKDGSVPNVVPDVMREHTSAAAAWGDAATFMPWMLYERYADRALLRRQLDSMRAWVDRLTLLAGENRLWAGGFQFGDWLDPTAPPDNPFSAKSDPDVVATAHFARSAKTVSKTADVLGETEIAQSYEELSREVADAFTREYVTPAGRVLSDSQTVYALALNWDLIADADKRARAAARLADLIRGAGFRIATGFVGTPIVLDALCDSGHVDTAYRLLLQRGCPSWLYPITMGATTIWERWDSLLPDGSINPGQMTSFNHYAFGAVADWLHRRVAGIAPGSPGYHKILIEPVPHHQLSSAAGRLETPYGTAAVTWTRQDGRFELHADVPVGTTAAVRLPGTDGAIQVAHGHHEWSVNDPVNSARQPVETIRDLLDDWDYWPKLVNIATAHDFVTGEVDLAHRLMPYFDHPATALVDVLREQPHKIVTTEMQDAVLETLAAATDPGDT